MNYNGDMDQTKWGQQWNGFVQTWVFYPKLGTGLRIMWVKQCQKPSMTGNGLYRIPPIKMLMTGGWLLLFYPH